MVAKLNWIKSASCALQLPLLYMNMYTMQQLQCKQLRKIQQCLFCRIYFKFDINELVLQSNCEGVPNYGRTMVPTVPFACDFMMADATLQQFSLVIISAGLGQVQDQAHTVPWDAFCVCHEHGEREAVLFRQVFIILGAQWRLEWKEFI